MFLTTHYSEPGPLKFLHYSVSKISFGGGRGGCYGRLAFIWRIEYTQDLPGAARRLLDSERFEGLPVSSFQERLCTLWKRGKKYMKVSWFLLDESDL